MLIRETRRRGTQQAILPRDCDRPVMPSRLLIEDRRELRPHRPRKPTPRRGYSLDAGHAPESSITPSPGPPRAGRRLNLGFGFVYYGLVRALRPQHVVVIGSGYGFSVVCLALGLKDNGAGALTFVDPSYSLLAQRPREDHRRRQLLARPRAGAARISPASASATSSPITSSPARSSSPATTSSGLPEIDLAFIDGNHSYAHVQHDVIAALRHSHRDTYLLLHDTNIYIREFLRHAGVKRWLQQERRPAQGGLRVRRFSLCLGRGRGAGVGAEGMEAALLIAAACAAAAGWAWLAAYLFWRYYWFWRNPPRTVPPGENFVSPADGTVVYVKRASAARADHRLQAREGRLDQRHRPRRARVAEDPHRHLHEPA